MTAASASDHGRSESHREIDASSYIHVETMSNADLYAVTPPAYAMSAAEGEVSLDAEAVADEKSVRPISSHAEASNHETRTIEGAELRSIRTGESATQIPTRVPDERPPVYFQELAVDAQRIQVRMCSVLKDRPAIWMVRRRNIALSPLAATVLIREGLIRRKDLDLISRDAGMKRDPTDPLSAVAFATYDTLGDILLGLVEGPVEAGRQFAPIIQAHEEKRKEDDEKRREGIAALVVGPSGAMKTEASPLLPRKSLPSSARVDEGVIGLRTADPACGSTPDGHPVLRDADAQSQVSDKEISNTNGQARIPHAAKQIAIGTGKGFGRMVGGAFKAPMNFTHGLARGFHNAPRLYGDEVREYENVTDLRSGLSVSAKSFGHGITDGVSGIFVQPIQGAQNGGVKGFAKGFGRGIGGVVFKPAAGAMGLVGYSLAGVHKEIQRLKPGKDSTASIFEAQGEVEYKEAMDEDRLNVVKRWCLVTMRQHA